MISVFVGATTPARVNVKTEELTVTAKEETKPLISVGASKAFTVKAEGNIVVVSNCPSYSGQYSVTPNAEQQTLATKNLRMKDDVTIKKIPTYTVSNEFGETFVIG